ARRASARARRRARRRRASPATLPATRSDHGNPTIMTESMTPIAQAADLLAQFEQQKDASLLDRAADQLIGIVLAREPDAEKRKALRADALVLWLRLAAALDAAWDPA